ncbi:DUF411 domain-containing protein [Microcoleus sp. FACHB-1515]|uniref:DUF411 domain-containing protein n=1 Tax=Cyanophyceae TaxID=3028117 RepID=UPI0018EF9F2F|nr:DUF411 domain-containing protein [Microcoleus sp. FACHB-1515]
MRRFVMQLDIWGLARRILSGLMIGLVAIAFSLALPAIASADAIEMTVYRDPGCRCCGGWMEHLRAEGFEPKNVPTEDMEAFKRNHGISEELSSCHTAVLDGYLIEGHVPVADIQRLLADRPQIAGIAVPGMPIGTPGMESDDGVQDAFEVVSFDEQGNSAVFSAYSPEG